MCVIVKVIFVIPNDVIRLIERLSNLDVDVESPASLGHDDVVMQPRGHGPVGRRPVSGAGKFAFVLG